MASRLALVSCVGPYEGQWTLAKGNEQALEIFDLGEGASIRYEWETDGLSESVDFHAPGVHPLPGTTAHRYRVSKVGAPGPATIVRVILNVKS